MTIQTHNDIEADQVFARADAGEFRILSMSRVRAKNAAWTFSVTAKELLITLLPEQPGQSTPSIEGVSNQTRATGNVEATRGIVSGDRQRQKVIGSLGTFQSAGVHCPLFISR
jgi:hypothetical protein